MHWLSLAGCTNWVIRLQTDVEWLFLTWFKVSKDLKRPDMSSFIARGPQNCLSSHEKKSFLGGINSVYKAVGSFIDCTSCTCQASTKYKRLKVVYPGWVGQSEFSKGWKWLLPRSRGGRHPNLIIVYASEAHTGTRLVHKTSTFELDFKLA